jgi:hypothetical protein
MKRPVESLSDAKLEAFPIVNLVEGWFFRVDERSIGCYVAEGIDRWGREVSKEGVDADMILHDCANAARSIQAKLNARVSGW